MNQARSPRQDSLAELPLDARGEGLAMMAGVSARDRLENAIQEIDSKFRMPESQYQSLLSEAHSLRGQIVELELVDDVEIIGSVARGTALAGYSDLDLAIVLDNSIMAGRSPSEVLSALATAVESFFVELAVDARVITASTASGIAVDLLPMFNAPNGGGVYTPSEGGDEWETNPVLLVDAILDDRYRAGGDRLRTIARVLKVWNIRHCVGLLSLEIELLVSLLGVGDYSSLSNGDAVREVLRRARLWLSGESRVDLLVGRPSRTAEETRAIVDTISTLEAALESVLGSQASGCRDSAAPLAGNDWMATFA